MAICVVVDNPNGSAELFDKVQQQLAASGAVPPAGAIFIVAGATPDGWRVITVWDSQESFQRFTQDHLFPAFQEVGLSQEGANVSVFEAHSYMASDVSGAAQAG
jgi:hypothetical protein